MKIACVIPAYNEEKKISQTIEQVKDLVDLIVVVDDNSQDETREILNEMTEKKLKKIYHPINLGQGAALQTGNEYCLKQNFDIIIHFDADGQFLANDIKRMIKPILEEDYDLVIGSRFMGIESNIPKFKKKIIMPMAKIFNNLFFGIKTSDPQNGFRVMTQKTVSKIKIENDRMAHCTEILAKAFKYKLKIKEIPIEVIYHEFGQKFSGGLKIIKDLFLKKISG
ncbi:MAG: glycosyltransferase family 2 protein [Patescibacteria group bacterium]|nr:glycosyltransferase family 2 protein [Patescibacteria group bacterium]